MKTHIKISILFVYCILLLVISSCKNNEVKQEVFIAEVGNSKLTESELESLLADNKGITKYRKELIKDWIETEVLNQVALEKNILKQDNYNKILKHTAKELAAALTISDYLESKPIIVTNSELIAHFRKNKKDYINSTRSYVVNLVSFNNEAKAIAFRNKGIVEGWEKALSEVENDSSVIEVVNNKIFKDYHIQSKLLLRVLKGQHLNEISPVVKTELNNFVVVQQIDRIEKNSIPDLKYIKDKVKESYIILKQKELVKNYIDSLITEKNAKIY